MLLLGQFAGSVARLHPEAAALFAATLADIEAQHGAAVKEALQAAAVKAGLLQEAAFYTDGMQADTQSAVSMGGLRDCGLLLMAQEPSLNVLLGVLVLLEDTVNDEKTYDLLMEEANEAAPALHRVKHAHIDPHENI